MATEPWQARVDGAMRAHFKQADGTTRPGTDYKIGLKRGDAVCQIFVRAYLAADLTAAARNDTAYQQQTVIGYVFDRTAGDWEPDGEMFPFPPVTILNPRPEAGADASTAPKRGFIGRLFGR